VYSHLLVQDTVGPFPVYHLIIDQGRGRRLQDLKVAAKSLGVLTSAFALELLQHWHEARLYKGSVSQDLHHVCNWRQASHVSGPRLVLVGTASRDPRCHGSLHRSAVP